MRAISRAWSNDQAALNQKLRRKPAAPALCQFPSGADWSDSMPEVNQYFFAHKELVELMIKKANIHEGKWMMVVNFAFAAVNGGPSPDEVVPTSVTGVQRIGIQQAQPDSPPGLVVDAADVNPVAGQAKPRKRKS